MAGFPDTPDETRSVELVQRIQAGDDEAWTELYRIHHDELLLAVRAQLGTRLREALQSEDILQSVALEAVRAMPRFEHRRPGGLRAFLHRLVVHKIRDRADTFGAKKRSGGVPLTDSVEQGLASPMPSYFDSDRFECLERGLARLPDDMRRAILLRRIEGRDYDEVAAELGTTDAAARKLFSRAMAKLSLIVGAREP